MIIARLAGGLGNQMFQYAIARKYQRAGTEEIILDDRLLQSFETDIEKILQRPFALDIFKNLKAKPIDSKLVKILNKAGFLNKIRFLFLNTKLEAISQELMEYVPFKSVNTKHIYLAGNFQSELYFSSLRNDLLEEFKFPDFDKKNEAIKNKILSNDNSVSIHIRRGDYLSTLNKNIFTSVNINYYQNAIQQLKQLLNSQNLNAFIFTDDIDWVKQNFSMEGLNMHFVEGNFAKDSWKDMALMTYCKHHIIANSSFSWWGAWLAKTDGINTAPKHWFLPNSYQFDINNIVPNSWNIIEYNL